MKNELSMETTFDPSQFSTDHTFNAYVCHSHPVTTQMPGSRSGNVYSLIFSTSFRTFSVTESFSNLSSPWVIIEMLSSQLKLTIMDCICIYSICRFCIYIRTIKVAITSTESMFRPSCFYSQLTDDWFLCRPVR